MKGRAQLTTITAASSGNSSIHQGRVNKHPRQLRCSCCGYNHLIGNCPTSGQQCYNCNGIGHYTALCKKPRHHRHNCRQSRYRPRTSSNHRHPSISPNRSRPSRKASRSPHAGNQDHLIAVTNTEEALHLMYIRSVTFYT